MSEEGEATSLAPAHALATALESGVLTKTAAVLTPQTMLWSSAHQLVPPRLGAVEIQEALSALLAMRAPTRVRVLRNGAASAVLSAFADEDALWSLEVQIEAGHIESMMVWMPAATRGAIASEPED